MKEIEAIADYTPLEERTNIVSHAIGFLLSLAACALLVTRASLHGNPWHIVSASVFGASLSILYAASTVYHSSKRSELRSRLKIIDHACIYVLIAGTYTPLTLVTLKGTIGWVMFGVSWGLALTGIILKLFFTGKYDLISTLMYVLMGWAVVAVGKPLIHSLPLEGLLWLFAGGMSYTIGALVYSIKKLNFNHAIFHMFVLGGSVCHFVAVFFYVLPSE
jgi:hemolysin III